MWKNHTRSDGSCLAGTPLTHGSAQALNSSGYGRCAPQVDVTVNGVLVDSSDLLWGEFQVRQRTHVCLKLSHAARSDQRRGNPRVTQCPGNGHLRERLAPRQRNVIQSSDMREIFIIEHVASQRAAKSGPGACGDPVQVAVGKEALRQNGEGNAPDSLSL